MEKLPFDMKMKLMQELTGKEILNVSSASHTMKSAFEQEKYDTLWKRKIEEKFGLKYNGKYPIEQYKFLSKVETMDFYVVRTEYEDESSFDGLFLSHEAAKEFLIRELIKRAKDFEEVVTYNQAMYKMGNKNEITYNGATRSIDKIQVVKFKDDETQRNNFFGERERLYQILFGKDSLGESLNIYSFGPRKKQINNPTIPESRQFFRELDFAIQSYGESAGYSVLKKFDRWNFSKEQKELLFNYIEKNAFIPQEIKGSDNEEIENSDEEEAEDN